MSSINSITVSGRLGRDPELRNTTSGKAVCSFSIAVDRRGKDAGTDWFQVVAWERLAELCTDFLTKGRHVTVRGRMTSREFEKDGVKRLSWEVVAEDLDFGPRVDTEQQPAARPAPARPQQQRPARQITGRQAADVAFGGVDFDDTVPF